jgi:hypothetical protein
MKKEFKALGMNILGVQQRYSDAIQRCYNPSHKLYPLYGARGIRIEVGKEEFFEWFLRELKDFRAEHPNMRPSLSRKNYDLGYALPNLELVTGGSNTQELYRRRGNRSPWGTKLSEDVQLLTIYTFPNTVPAKELLKEHFNLTRNAVNAVMVGRNWKKVFYAAN